MRQPGIDWPRKRLLECLDLLCDCFQSSNVVCVVATALLVSNYYEAFSESLRQISESVFHRISY